MRTYSIQLLDDNTEIHELPSNVTTLEEASIYAQMHFQDKGQVRICEHFWMCATTTPHLVSMDTGNEIPPPPEAPMPPDAWLIQDAGFYYTASSKNR